MKPRCRYDFASVDGRADVTACAQVRWPPYVCQQLGGALVEMHHRGHKQDSKLIGNVCFWPIVLKNSLRKFELVRSEKMRPRQSLSVELNVQICTESNRHGRRDRKFGRPFVKKEFFNRIGRSQPVDFDGLRCRRGRPTSRGTMGSVTTDQAGVRVQKVSV